MRDCTFIHLQTQILLKSAVTKLYETRSSQGDAGNI